MRLLELLMLTLPTRLVTNNHDVGVTLKVSVAAARPGSTSIRGVL